MEKQCTKCHSKEILIKHPVRKWPNGNPEEFYVCSNKKCPYHKFSISEEELSQAILSAEERGREEEREKVCSTKLVEPPEGIDGLKDSRQVFLAGQMNMLFRIKFPDQEQLSNSKTE